MRRAVVVRGGWDGHSPVAATDLFRPFLEHSGFDVEVHDSPEIYVDGLAEVDLIVQCYTMGSASDEAIRGLSEAIAAGTGMMGWHGGIADSFRNSADYLHLIGGQFACHPAKAPQDRVGDGTDVFIPYTVDIVPQRSSHPIVAGMSSFELVTEQYWVLSDEYCDVLATTTHPVQPWHPWHRPVIAPAIWTRQWGQGRICVITPGHDIPVLTDPNVRRLIERGMTWASR